MKHCLFIKTYKNDFPWLKYCLLSIKKFCIGYDEVVIVCPIKDINELGTLIPEGFPFAFKFHGVEEYGEGYLYQQMVKMNAHNYTDCQFIQYLDSDCIFHTPTKPQDYFEGDKPAMLKTRYGNLGDAEMWRSVVYDALGFLPDYEYMRRQNFVYNRETLMNIQRTFPKMNDHIMTRPGRHFSEFNVMGAFAEKYEPNNYIWKDTDTTPFEHERLKQFWSWSGCTEKEKREMEEMLK